MQFLDGMVILAIADLTKLMFSTVYVKPLS